MSSPSYLYVAIEQDANSGKYNVTFVPSNLYTRSYNSTSSSVTSNYEIARLNWARYNGTSFVVPTTYSSGTVTSNAAGLTGSAVANLTMDAADKFETNRVYSFLALITRTATTGSSVSARRAVASTGFTVYPLENVTEVGTDDGSVVTSVGQVAAVSGVTRVVYYNALGMSSTVPFEGINLVVTTHADGTRTVVKTVK